MDVSVREKWRRESIGSRLRWVDSSRGQDGMKMSAARALSLSFDKAVEIMYNMPQ